MPRYAQLVALECPVCLLAGAEFGEVAEAVQLAGTHDDLLHQGRPTTVIRCEAASFIRRSGRPVLEGAR